MKSSVTHGASNEIPQEREVRRCLNASHGAGVLHAFSFRTAPRIFSFLPPSPHPLAFVNARSELRLYSERADSGYRWGRTRVSHHIGECVSVEVADGASFEVLRWWLERPVPVGHLMNLGDESSVRRALRLCIPVRKVKLTAGEESFEKSGSDQPKPTVPKEDGSEDDLLNDFSWNAGGETQSDDYDADEYYRFIRMSLISCDEQLITSIASSTYVVEVIAGRVGMKLRGKYPWELCTALQVVDLSLVNLSAVSCLSGMERLDTLVELNLSHTQLVDLRPLRFAPKLQKLNAEWTQVNNIGILGLCNLHSLWSLSLAFCKSITDARCLADPLMGTKKSSSLYKQNTHRNEKQTKGEDTTHENDTDDDEESNASETAEPFPNLRTLNLSGTVVTTGTIVGLENLRHLSDLDLSYTSVDSINAFKVRYSLSRLNLHNCARLGNEGVSELRGCLRSLVAVDLFGSGVTDLSFLSGCSNLAQITTARETTSETLKHLELLPKLYQIAASLSRISSLSNLTLCSALTNLTLSHTLITSVGLVGVERIATLKVLNLSSTQITDVRCLASCPALTTLQLQRCPVTTEGLEGIQRVHPLQTLNISNTLVDSVRFLGTCALLKSLDASHCPITSSGLDGLHTAARLTSLNLSDTRVTTIPDARRYASLTELKLNSTPFTQFGLQEVGRMPVLEKLDVSQATRLAEEETQTVAATEGSEGVNALNTNVALVPRRSTFSALFVRGERSCLKELNLSGIAGIGGEANDFVGIVSCTSLRKLTLTDCPDVNDVSVHDGVAKSRSIEELDLSGCAGVTGMCIGSLARMPALQTLDLSKTGITQLTPLGLTWHCPQASWSVNRGQRRIKSQLRSLRAAETGVNSAGIAGLVPLDNLEDLDLSGSQVDDANVLASCRLLRRLNLSGTPITANGIRSLASARRLEDLDISKTTVNDITFFSSAPLLERINVHESSIPQSMVASMPSYIRIQAGKYV